MRIETKDLAGVVVATPVGRLDLASYPVLRDGLLGLTADSQNALVVRLGPDLEVPSRAMLSVFTKVWTKVSRWPDIPMVLLAESDEHRDELDISGVDRLVRTTDSLQKALIAVERPPHGIHRVALPSEPTAPLMARATVREACEQWDLPKVRDDAVLVVSELVENAVQHAHSESVLRVELRPTGLSLAVRDNDPAPPTLPDPRLDLPGHRGMQLVDRLAVAWGYAPSSGGGKVVWAVLDPRG